MRSFSDASSLQRFVQSLGGLHDATIESFAWLPVERVLRFAVDDVHSNFLGLPEYPGVARGEFSFQGVTKFESSLDFATPSLAIYDWSVSANSAGSIRSVIGFSPGGRLLIECQRLGLS